MGARSKAGPPAPAPTTSYGADLTTRQFVVVVIALALGTCLEWFDYFSFSLMHATLTAIFFPTTNPTLQQISFWGVFFIGFVARPIGSVFFGHIGDTRGRRLTLLLSIVLMAVPTVLIGCLPTYAQAGIAAPVLLALLRLVQGLAMGGEFGSALVYLHEIASKRSKGFTGSIGFASAISGCILGVLVVLILEATLTPSQMLVFGWRLPFLLSSVSASAALALRLHMPEPHEFIKEKELLEQALYDAATLSPTASFRRTGTLLVGRSSDSSTGGQPRCSTSSSSSSADDLECGDASTGSGRNGPSDSTVVLGSATPAAAKLKAAAAGPTAQQLRTGCSHSQQAVDSARSSAAGGGGGAAVGCWRSLPVFMLLRWHWAGVLLNCAFEAYVSCSFYTLTTWLPMAMNTTLGVPLAMTRGMLVVNLLVCVLMQLAAGYASDRGLPRIWSSVSVYAIGGAVIGPILLCGMQPGASLGTLFVLHALLLALCGWVLGLIPASCSPIYPASVRTTGFNLAHNMSMSWLGGLSPTIVTALTAVMHNKFMAPTVLLAAAAGVSLVAGLILIWYAPATNRTPVDDAQPGAA